MSVWKANVQMKLFKWEFGVMCFWQVWKMKEIRVYIEKFFFSLRKKMVNYSGNQKAVAFYHTRWIKNNANLCGMLLAIEFGPRNPIKEKELQNVINSQVLNKSPIRLRLAGQDQGLCRRAAEGALPVWRWWDFSSAICRNYFWVWQGWGLCFIAALRLWLSYFLQVWATSLHLPSNFSFWGACVVDN